MIAEVWTLLDGECTEDTRAKLRRHLEECPSLPAPLRRRGAHQGADRHQCGGERAPEGLRQRLLIEITRTTIIREASLSDRKRPAALKRPASRPTGAAGRSSRVGPRHRTRLRLRSPRHRRHEPGPRRHPRRRPGVARRRTARRLRYRSPHRRMRFGVNRHRIKTIEELVGDIDVDVLVCNHMFTPSDSPKILDTPLETQSRMLDINARLPQQPGAPIRHGDARPWQQRDRHRLLGRRPDLGSLQRCLRRQQGLPARAGRDALVRAARHRRRRAGHGRRPDEHTGRRVREVPAGDDRRARGCGQRGCSRRWAANT